MAANVNHGWALGAGLGACTALAGCSSITDVRSCSVSSEAELSSEIPTVAVVRWRVNGTEARNAQIVFGRDEDPEELIAPAPVTERGQHRAVLLGMKPNSQYTYRISVNDGQCQSEPMTVETGGPPANLPRLTFEEGTAFTRGFYILSSGFGAELPTGGAAKLVYIIDQDGDPVWWWTAPAPASRATMDWSGEHMYMLALNVSGAGRSLFRVKMDGSESRDVNAIGNAHHDFTVTPDGHVVAIVHSGKSDGVVEYDPEAGTIEPLVADVSSLYAMANPEYHANAITYRRDDDSFIMGDRFPSLLVNFDRRGRLRWQFGGSDPIGPSFSGTGSWRANHGHHWTDDGHLLVFNNGAVSTSRVLDFAVDEANLEARLLREYATEGLSSLVLGDVQQLPNKNVLTTFSTSGRLIEYLPSGETLAHLHSSTSLGYTMYRRTLYGPPDK